MATKLVRPQIPSSHVLPSSIPPLSKIMRSQAQRPPSTNHPIHRNFVVLRSNSTIKVAEQSSSLVGDEEEEEKTATGEPLTDYSIRTRVKSDINNALQGINRGIFGIPSEKKSEIEDLVKVLESLNPNPHPTVDLDKLGGCWKLIYSTITILGSKRTKLGLRDFISLGEFFQVIDIAEILTCCDGEMEGKAVNVVKFNVRGLNLLSGKLIIEASFKVSSKSRVDISYNNSTIVPDQLMNMFRKNYDILLGIFNPDGWLEITYVDETLRIGRDDKGNIFILERSEETNP